MPLNFAYGSNMDAAAMARRCPRSRLVGRARLARWRFVVMPSGFASVVPDPRANVYGALWEVPVSDVAALDRYEQVGQGLYAKRMIPVLKEPFGASPALVYVGVNPHQGAAWPGYLADILSAAEKLDLPKAYLGYLSYLLAERKKGARG
ncbi:gamma-glutamylcyclotransferase family protein [Methylocystis parvus]|uniref:Gamma-glutamylcyclotransferase n=2 Tax=Methylocystis parvus TaxID=134 RepID=A0A6B8M1J9_9HYPH|nr:gamma-glutamylcyclotransferase family protein [Methylocystis parvus]QGM96162.1 gamma-glutamylcyclotransferase [Methylocystis parvus]